MNTDAAVPGLNRNNVYRIEIPDYPEKLIQRFSRFIESFKNIQYNNIKENKSLTDLRDLMLPKLLSGKLLV